jgi:hypothetical protein
MTSGNAKTKVVDSAGADVSYITAGTAGAPSPNVLSVQGINGGVSLPISGTVTANVLAGNTEAIVARQIAVGADGDDFNSGTGRVAVDLVDNVGNSIGGVSRPIQVSGTVTAVDLGAKADAVASTDTGTFSVIALIKRSLQNWTSLLAKIPDLVSGRIPVDGSGVTQPISVSSLPLPSGASTAAKQPALGTAGTPSSDVITVQGTSAGTALNTKETQPIGDYVVNVGAASTISLSGSAVTTASFDAGTTADYIVVTIEGGGVTGGFYIDGSPDNTSWTSGQYTNVYYDVPTSSSTDAYSYRTVSGQLFGATRSNYYGRFIVSCTQPNPYVNQNNTFRYFRITTPATYGSWKYKFVSYKTTTYSLGGANPGGIARVNGRVDVGYVSNLPTLSATVTPVQGTASAITTFISTTPSTSLIAAGSTRKTLTVYNSGAGDLYISPTATCTTTNFQVKLASGDYWECPDSQTSLAHTAVFGTAGTAYVTAVT